MLLQTHTDTPDLTLNCTAQVKEYKHNPTKVSIDCWFTERAFSLFPKEGTPFSFQSAARTYEAGLQPTLHKKVEKLTGQSGQRWLFCALVAILLISWELVWFMTT